MNTPPINDSDPNGDFDGIVSQVQALGQRVTDVEKVKELILKMCFHRSFKATESAKILEREEDYFKRNYLSKMIAEKELVYKYPDMINHPDQAYITGKTSKG